MGQLLTETKTKTTSQKYGYRNVIQPCTNNTSDYLATLNINCHSSLDAVVAGCVISECTKIDPLGELAVFPQTLQTGLPKYGKKDRKEGREGLGGKGREGRRERERAMEGEICDQRVHMKSQYVTDCLLTANCTSQRVRHAPNQCNRAQPARDL